MKVVVAGAGAVGRSIARELLDSDHQVTLIERNPVLFWKCAAIFFAIVAAALAIRLAMHQ